jgi:hypothetical protein
LYQSALSAIGPQPLYQPALCGQPTAPLAWPPPAAEFLPLPRLNALEQDNFEGMKEELVSSIAKGVGFMNGK